MLEQILFYIVLIVYFLVCLFMILVILSQEGKGGGLSGMMGSSALGETFGFGGASNALRRWTRNVAILFMVLTILITFWGARHTKSMQDVFLQEAAAAAEALPGADELQPGQVPAAVTPVATIPGEAVPVAVPAEATPVVTSEPAPVAAPAEVVATPAAPAAPAEEAVPPAAATPPFAPVTTP
ncbi:preprotein translocase subunit SecG [candidate division BRC1 bacterium HGW-BRC1-1]|jgi:preprotein translocase subunit SecG|nr:MAG: preprotein translocase subunit SecG [candidate division BRC1 bacterium HGW-BRC1-1]